MPGIAHSHKHKAGHNCKSHGTRGSSEGVCLSIAIAIAIAIAVAVALVGTCLQTKATHKLRTLCTCPVGFKRLEAAWKAMETILALSGCISAFRFGWFGHRIAHAAKHTCKCIYIYISINAAMQLSAQIDIRMPPNGSHALSFLRFANKQQHNRVT